MKNDRVKTVVEDLERLLLDFMRKHRITHHEYRRATDILVGTVKAGEESLLWLFVGYLVALTVLVTALTILAVDIRVVMWIWHP